jgi:hypothetical protein
MKTDQIEEFVRYLKPQSARVFMDTLAAANPDFAMALCAEIASCSNDELLKQFANRSAPSCAEDCRACPLGEIRYREEYRP